MLYILDSFCPYQLSFRQVLLSAPCKSFDTTIQISLLTNLFTPRKHGKFAFLPKYLHTE